MPSIFHDIRQRCAQICGLAEHVKINPDKVNSFCQKLDFQRDPTPWFSMLPLQIEQTDFESILRYYMLFTATSFTYWPRPKWNISYQGEPLNGCLSLATCYAQAIRNKLLSLSPEDWTKIDVPLYLEITQSDSGTIISMAEERVKALNSIGHLISSKYSNSFHKFMNIHHDAEEMVYLLANSAYSFDDVHAYRGAPPIPFLKKAQLYVAVLAYYKALYDGIALPKANHLTACADYKLPQLLRDHGLISYSAELSQLINTGQIISNGSAYEVEIRAAVVAVVEMMRLEVCSQKSATVTAMQINDMIWMAAMGANKTGCPHHKTYTVYY